MNSDRLLIIFLKNPVAGQVKSRLAADIGEVKALEVFTVLYEAIRKAALPINAKKHLYYASRIATNDDWPAHIFQKHLQSKGDIGLRMHNALENAFRGGYKKVCLIGTDIYQLSSSILDEAFQLLEKNEAVIGPAMDGGYYLIGLTRMIPTIFDNIPWSTSHVFDETIFKFEELGTHYALLPELYDIDTLDDLKKAGLFRK